MRRFGSLLVIAATFASVAAAFTAALAARFGFGPWIVPAHAVLVLVLLAGTVLLIALLRRAWPGSRCAVLGPLTALAAGLVSLYAFTWVGRTAWMEVLSLEVLLAWAPRFPALAAQMLPVSLWWIALAVAAPGAGLLWLLWRSAPAVGGAADRLLASAGGRAPVRTGILTLAAGAVISGGAYWTVKDMLPLRGEPLTGLLPHAASHRIVVSQLPPDMAAARRTGKGPRPGTAVRAATEPRKHVILIVVDALRADRLPGRGYARDLMPRLAARLAAQPVLTAQWATAACPISLCGVLALLTSHQYARLGPDVVGLPDVLADAGYTTWYVMSGDFTFGYPGVKALFAPRARLFRDGLTTTAYAPYDDRHVLDGLGELPKAGLEPAFIYVHLHSAHAVGARVDPPVYTPASRGLEAFAAHGLRGWLTRLLRHVTKDHEVVPTDLRSLVNYYDNGVRQADRMVDEVLAHLATLGYLERATTVITSDHGEALGEHGDVFHGDNLFGESLDVPILVFDRDLEAGRAVPYAIQQDVAPTVADLAGVAPHPSWEGRSLRDGVSPEWSFHQTTHLEPLHAVIWRRDAAVYKYVYDTRDGREQVFDLAADPAERVDLIGRAPAEVRAALRAAHARNWSSPLPVGLHDRR